MIQKILFRNETTSTAVHATTNATIPTNAPTTIWLLPTAICKSEQYILQVMMALLHSLKRHRDLRNNSKFYLIKLVLGGTTTGLSPKYNTSAYSTIPILTTPANSDPTPTHSNSIHPTNCSTAS